MMVIPTLLARAQIAEAEADYAKVRQVAEPLTRMAAGTSLQEPGYWPWPDLLANALVLDGQLDAADDFLRPHEQRAKARATAPPRPAWGTRAAGCTARSATSTRRGGRSRRRWNS